MRKRTRFTMWSAVVKMGALGIVAIALSGCASRGLNAVEKMMWSTYPIATPKGMATGFVVACRDPQAPGGTAPVVVTSVHVLETVGRGMLSLGARVPDATGEPQVAVLQLRPRRGRALFYSRHPRHDLAAFALHLPEDFAQIVTVGSFLDQRSIAGHRVALRAGAEVSFLGFPEVLPGTPDAFPVLRTGRVASVPVGTATAQGLFVINADVYPGDSGAPVFAVRRGGRPELVGMIIRRIGTDERAFSHLAIAVDATAIRETLGLVAAREQDRASLPQRPRSASAHRTTCQACHRIRDKYPAGLIMLRGAFVREHAGELLQLVRHHEQAEKTLHPLHRILRIEEMPDAIAIETTDLHLPHRIADALEHAYHGTLKIHYDEEGYFVRVEWQRDT